MKATKQVVTISAIFAVLLVALITYTLGAFSEAANTVEPGSVDPLDTAGNTDFLVAAKSAVTSINVAQGTQKITYESGRVLERHVQVWKAKGDDRYRVRVTSLDDTGASEEVAVTVPDISLCLSLARVVTWRRSLSKDLNTLLLLE
jgi:hypothetical protein